MTGTPEIVVIGGGPAGAAAAIGLARTGARVQLLERTHGDAFKPGEILEPTIRTPLAELGLLERFDGLGFLPVAGNLSTWGSPLPVETESICNPFGPGYLVDRCRMEQWLLAEAVGAGAAVSLGVREVVLEPASPARVAWNDGRYRHECQPALVIEATGRARSIVGQAERDYLDDLVSLLSYSETAPATRARDQRLVIETFAQGWWYSVPLPDGRYVIACMTDVDLIPPKNDRKAWFERQLAMTPLTSARLDTASISGPLLVRSAASSKRRTVAGPGWVAIGDAAATYDPLSGRGVMAALSKGAALARLIAGRVDLERATQLYADAERDAFSDFIGQWRETYRREQRWSSSRFWTRRHRAAFPHPAS